MMPARPAAKAKAAAPSMSPELLAAMQGKQSKDARSAGAATHAKAQRQKEEVKRAAQKLARQEKADANWNNVVHGTHPQSHAAHMARRWLGRHQFDRARADGRRAFEEREADGQAGAPGAGNRRFSADTGAPRPGIRRQLTRRFTTGTGTGAGAGADPALGMIHRPWQMARAMFAAIIAPVSSSFSSSPPASPTSALSRSRSRRDSADISPLSRSRSRPSLFARQPTYVHARVYTHAHIGTHACPSLPSNPRCLSPEPSSLSRLQLCSSPLLLSSLPPSLLLAHSLTIIVLSRTPPFHPPLCSSSTLLFES